MLRPITMSLCLTAVAWPALHAQQSNLPQTNTQRSSTQQTNSRTDAQQSNAQETIELTTGQRHRGRVISMNAEHVQFRIADQDAAAGGQSGQLQTFPRSQVARITLGEIEDGRRRSFSISRMLREMREGGFDEQAWQDLQRRIQFIETPELRRYLDDTIAGLKRDMEQVRRDAEEAQQEITSLREEYAPQADTLNDYLVALQQIIGATGELDDARVSVAVDVDDENDADDADAADIEDEKTAPRGEQTQRQPPPVQSPQPRTADRQVGPEQK